MKNGSLGLVLLVVITISIVLAATKIISIAGAFLFAALMALVLIAVQQERVRYEKRFLAQKLHLERLLARSN